jgi:hypothetical protein
MIVLLNTFKILLMTDVTQYLPAGFEGHSIIAWGPENWRFYFDILHNVCLPAATHDQLTQDTYILLYPYYKLNFDVRMRRKSYYYSA